MHVPPFPQNFRDVFALFRFYREELGVQALLTDIDVDGLTARDVYRACHGREPENESAASSHERHTIPDLFERAIRSFEFQNNLVERFIAAYPEKRCLSFVHVPKSAGSDLSTHLITRYPSLRTTIIDPGLTGRRAFYQSLKELALEASVSDSIYIHGHNELKTYVKWGVARPQDHVFTTIRDPVSLTVSQVNYVLTRMRSVADPLPHDTAGWRKLFGVDDPEMLDSPQEVQRLAHRILRDPGVVPPDNTCHFLGHGDRDSAIEAMIEYNVEITDLRRYTAWLKERWEVRHLTRMNASKPFMRLEDFAAEDTDYIHETTRHDKALYDHIAGRLDDTGATSLRGREIAAPVYAAA
ncbi:MAG: hypothetical protein JSS43_31310 [Proteobacteria bacterium]|nr:hypothetical protein [Pseudomonadota bacterium]